MAISTPTEMARKRKLSYIPSPDDYSQGIIDPLPSVEEIMDTAATDDETSKKFLDLAVTAKQAGDAMKAPEQAAAPEPAPKPAPVVSDAALPASDITPIAEPEKTPTSQNSIMKRLFQSPDSLTDYGLPLLGVLEAITSQGRDPGTTALSAQKQLREQKTYDEQQATTKEERRQKALDRRNTELYLQEVKSIPATDPQYQQKVMKVALRYEKDPTKVMEYAKNLKAPVTVTPELIDSVKRVYANDPNLPMYLLEATQNPEKFMSLASATGMHEAAAAPALEEKKKEFGKNYDMKKKQYDDLKAYREQMLNIGWERVKKMPGIALADADALSAAISAGKVDPYHINSRNAAVLAKAYETNPEQNLNDLAAQAQYERSTQTSGQKALLSNMYPLIDKVRGAGEALGNSNNQFVNGIVNWVAEKTGDPRIVDFDNLRDETVMEMQKALTGAGVASDTRYVRAVNNLKSAQSQAQLNAALDAMKAVTDSRLQAIKTGPNPNAARPAQNVQPTGAVANTPKGHSKIFDVGGHQIKFKKLNDGPDNVQSNWDQE